MKAPGACEEYQHDVTVGHSVKEFLLQQNGYRAVRLESTTPRTIPNQLTYLYFFWMLYPLRKNPCLVRQDLASCEKRVSFSMARYPKFPSVPVWTNSLTGCTSSAFALTMQRRSIPTEDLCEQLHPLLNLCYQISVIRNTYLLSTPAIEFEFP